MGDKLNRRALRFLLVPDASAGRQVRRALATSGARSGIAVGTWHDLLDRARQACFISVPADDQAGFERSLMSVENAFWEESLSVAPTETARSLLREFVDVVSSSDPETALGELEVTALASRPRRMMDDLKRLSRQLETRLPGDLEAIRRLLRVDSKEARQPICVQRIREFPRDHPLAGRTNRKAQP